MKPNTKFSCEKISEKEFLLLYDLKIDKNFEKTFIFEKIDEIYLSHFSSIKELIFSKTSFSDITNLNFKKNMEKEINEIKTNLAKEFSSINSKKNFLSFDEAFEDMLLIISRTSNIAKQSDSEIKDNLLEYKELQKLSRSQEHSFFPGNMYALGIYGAFKGVKSLYNSYSESNERNKFKNKMEENFMNEFYLYMEENFFEEFYNSLYMVYQKIYLFFSKQNIFLIDLDILIKNKDIFNKKYSKKLKKVNIFNLLKLYPYSKKIWEDFFWSLSLNELFEVERNLKENDCKKTLENLLNIKTSKILSESTDLKLIHKVITKNSTEGRLEKLKKGNILKHFSVRLKKDISEEELKLFSLTLEHILNLDRNENIIKREEFLFINLIKANLNNEIEEFFNKNREEIFLEFKKILNFLEKYHLFTNFFHTRKINNYLRNEYNNFVEKIKYAKNEKFKSIQNLINDDLKIIKNIPINERGNTKFFILSDYFENNLLIRDKIKKCNFLDEKTIMLTWDTKFSTGIITLTSLIFKIPRGEFIINFLDIYKVKLNFLTISILTKNEEFEITLFDEKEFSPEKENATKSIALYIKKISTYWKNEDNSTRIYLSKDFIEINNYYSRPIYTLEFIFNLNIKNIYFKEFLKNGFVNKKIILQKEKSINDIISNLKYLGRDIKNIEFPPFPTKRIDELQIVSKRTLNKRIKNEILAIYKENTFEENASILLLTEDSLIIFTHSFGEIPLKIIKNINLKGFSSHSLEIKTTKGDLTCLLASNSDDNKYFINLIKEYLLFFHAK